MPAIDMSVWQGRIDAAEGSLARRWHQVMRALADDTDASAVVLIGFACDAGVARNQGRIGAAGGPAAMPATSLARAMNSKRRKSNCRSALLGSSLPDAFRSCSVAVMKWRSELS